MLAVDTVFLPVAAPQHTIPLGIGLKRSSEELLSLSPMVTNGTGMSPTQADVNNEAKKAKLEAGKPSRVLHFRGVPLDTTEGEIVQLGLPFGRMTNLVLAKKKNQALLEMADVQSAQAMVNYYSERPPQIRGRTVYVQFSNHEQLKTETSAQNEGARAALQAARNMNMMGTGLGMHHGFERNGQGLDQFSLSGLATGTNGILGDHLSNGNANAQAALQAAQQLMGSMDEQPKTVLRVIVEHMLYPVTIDVLKQIFSRYGQVIKIVTFNKNNTYQALIQYSEPIAAQTAKVTLNGQNIYNGCCTLRIDFSKLTSLNVKYNNDKSRDYTNPTLPSGDGMPSQFDPHAMGLGGGLGAFQAAVPFGLAGMSPMQNAMGVQQLRMAGQPQMGSVLLASNLNEQKVTPDALFTLFGVYGDVIRVKIMFNKKDNALIQFADSNQAQMALTHIDKVKVWGKIIKLAPSKHSVVQMPKEGQTDAGLTKDYTNSPLHRFKKPNSKNHHNIFPPSATLHLSNIPPTTTEENLRELFEEHGEVVAFKFFQKDRKMALIQMGSCEEAIHALMALHNIELGNASHLRVSFTKSVI